MHGYSADLHSGFSEPAVCVRGFLKPTSIIRDAESVRCELQASRGGFDRSWTLEAEKQQRGDPPAITCRFLQGPHGNSGLDRRLQRRSFFVLKPYFIVTVAEIGLNTVALR